MDQLPAKAKIIAHAHIQNTGITQINVYVWLAITWTLQTSAKPV
jgi:hypothetical protein